MRLARYPVTAAILVVFIARVLFVITYPLNDFGGDTHNYLTMLLQGRSSLVHAGGYPFLVGLPFRIPLIQSGLVSVLPYMILILQHTVDVLVLLFLYGVASSLYGRMAGTIAMLLEGLSIQRLSAT